MFCFLSFISVLPKVQEGFLVTSKLRSVTVKGDERDNSGLQPPWGFSLRETPRQSTSTAVLPKLHKKKEKNWRHRVAADGCRWHKMAQLGSNRQLWAFMEYFVTDFHATIAE